MQCTHISLTSLIIESFQELLSGITEPCQPVIFFRDVKFSDLQHLVEFIYTGQLDIPLTQLDSFLSFAQSLGVRGFLSDIVSSDLKSPSKRKIFDKKVGGVRGERSDKENLVPGVNTVVRSPALVKPAEGVKIVNKRRKVLSSLQVNTEPVYANTPHHQETRSLDSQALDPEELAAKGHHLLHHLAVWMIQQRQEAPGSNLHPAVPDQMPEPSLASPHQHSQSLPVRRQTLQQSVPSSQHQRPLPLSSRTNTQPQPDRPDSGFDSKDEEGRDQTLSQTEGSSPEIGEISRQAVARQPVVKKKRILHCNKV